MGTQAEPGQKGLEIIKQLKLNNDTVALFLTDQRIPQITGVEFLAKTMDIFPDAKRVLLTDYGDTNAVMKSINKVTAGQPQRQYGPDYDLMAQQDIANHERKVRDQEFAN